MATSIRGSAINGKEKKGTSPSSTLKKTPKPSSSTSSPNDEKSSSSINNTKPIPNYLKPTISSSFDPNKPITTRRKSVDRPPPASHAQRPTRASPSPTGLKTQRSSSFSNRSISSSSSSSSSVSRPGIEKLYSRTSSLKDGKVNPNLSKSRSLKKTTLSENTKKESTPSLRKKGPKSLTSESSVDYENQKSVEILILEDELNLDTHEIQSLPEMSEMPDSNEELGDPTNVKAEEESMKSSIDDQSGHDDEKKWIIVDDDQTDHDDEKNSMIFDEVQHFEEIKHDDPQPVIEESDENEGTGDCEQQSTGDQEEYETEENVREVEEVKEEVDPTNATNEKETVSSPTVSIATPSQTSQNSLVGKKEKQDYNDVIEETATKLMGGKKNKVLALAGAFETVISLQDTNKN